MNLQDAIEVAKDYLPWLVRWESAKGASDKVGIAFASLIAHAEQSCTKCSDTDIADWVERHDLKISGRDARAAFEDAQTTRTTHAGERQ